MNESGLLDELERGLSMLQNELLTRLEQLEQQLNELHKSEKNKSNGSVSCEQVRHDYSVLADRFRSWLKALARTKPSLVESADGAVRFQLDLGRKARTLRGQASICNNCKNRFENDSAFTCQVGHTGEKAATSCTHYEPLCDDVVIDLDLIELVRQMTDLEFLVRTARTGWLFSTISSDDPIICARGFVERHW